MKIKSGFRLHPLAGEEIIVANGVESINFSKIISLNTSAAWLWKTFADGREFTNKEMATLLVERYNITNEQALSDAIELTESWAEVGLISR